ncbi:MAG: glycosyltransferase family 2 protein [bacterium]|nr:glycosyltransferase family 2 protein [bacterium]
MKRINIVIPTFNRKDCLRTLLLQLNRQVMDGADYQYRLSVTVVVDGSGDGTLEMLQTEFPDATVVKGTGDWWWTRSVNEGCKAAVKKGADAVLLMNDDTEIKDDYMQALLNAARQEPDAVIGSLNITLETPPLIYFSGVKKINWWKAQSVRYHQMFAPYHETAPPAAAMTGLHPSVLLMGRGLFIPVRVLETTGYLDEKSFPQYKADVDFVLTAGENNIKTLISWDAVIYSHMGLTGKGATFTDQGFFTFLAAFFRRNTYINLTDSFRYYKKHCPVYLLPISYIIDKMRLIYSYWRKRKQAKCVNNVNKELQTKNE